MRLILVLLMLVGCSDSPGIETSLKQLHNSTTKLEFSTFTLECLVSFDIENLKTETRRLNLPREQEVMFMFIDAKIYECVQQKYENLVTE